MVYSAPQKVVGGDTDWIYFKYLDFTGISAPYEAPVNPEVHIKTGEVDIATGVKILVAYLTGKGFI